MGNIFSLNIDPMLAAFFMVIALIAVIDILQGQIETSNFVQRRHDHRGCFFCNRQF